MRPLSFNAPNGYFINSKRPFNGNRLHKNDIKKAFDFAYEMCFGSGFHRDHRSGGQSNRRNGEKFSNTFQGKLAEIALFQFFTSSGLECSPVDFRIMGQNLWDDSDFVVNGKHINVKSAAFFSNLLLLEEKDWNHKGHYLPNLENGNTYRYDFFVFIRIKPDIKNILRKNRLFYSDKVEKNELFGLISAEDWFYDIPGFMTHSIFLQEIISKKRILPQSALLNGRTKMDASNYYIQTGDLNGISEIITSILA
ncbi:hypothetical protein [Hyunsoonleella rubra]|uniref:Restriction endonuclease n=1 Tax=Hyunsoonleella rubra TaxID=1737062 RepID=A0ABW5TBB6_9FLAO